jgi:hypothetical protein
VIETVDNTPVIPEVEEKRFHLGRRIAIGASLGVVSAAAFYAQHSGMTDDMSWAGEKVAESMSHPAVGYLGALATVLLAGKFKYRPAKKSDFLIGATIANAAAETAQDVAVNVTHLFEGINNNAWFIESSQWGESAKDYLAALGGLGIFMLGELIGKKSQE